ncbi:MAG: flap endonuclease-1 [Candidatus Micrarchaeota archaeon]|nr:flap endonuclease-1 [Candidatus Micrarchaeota archaeon]
MGVDIGNVLIKRPIKLESLEGRRIAIDSYNMIYQFLTTIRQKDGTPLMDSKGRVTSHLSGLLYRVSKLLEMNIQPIFIFDGEPPKFKIKTIEKRQEIKAQAQRRLEEAIARGETELKTYAQATVKMTEEIVEESKKMLELMGVPVVMAPSEGEAEAARLVSEGMAYAVGSQDYDSLLFGANRLVRNITLSGRRKLPGKGVWVEVEPELIDANESFSAIGMTRNQMIWAAMMIGTDYFEGIKGIGPKKGVAIAKESSSLKECFEKAKASEIYEENKVELEEIERFFLNPPKPKQEPSIQFRDPKKDEIIDFLCGEHEFMIERVEGALDRIMKKEEGKSQTKLDSWFS